MERSTTGEELARFDASAPVYDMDAAAEHLGITTNTLRAYRFKRYPPGHRRAFPEPQLRVGNGRVPLWSREQLDGWSSRR